MERTSDLERRVDELERRNKELERRLAHIEGMLAARSVAPVSVAPVTTSVSPKSSSIAGICNSRLGNKNGLGEWLVRCCGVDPRTLSRTPKKGQIVSTEYKKVGEFKLVSVIGDCLLIVNVTPTGTTADYGIFHSNMETFFLRIGDAMSGARSVDKAMNLWRQIRAKNIHGVAPPPLTQEEDDDDMDDADGSLSLRTSTPPSSGFGGFFAPP